MQLGSKRVSTAVPHPSSPASSSGPPPRPSGSAPPPNLPPPIAPLPPMLGSGSVSAARTMKTPHLPPPPPPVDSEAGSDQPAQPRFNAQMRSMSCVIPAQASSAGAARGPATGTVRAGSGIRLRGASGAGPGPAALATRLSLQNVATGRSPTSPLSARPSATAAENEEPEKGLVRNNSDVVKKQGPPPPRPSNAAPPRPQNAAPPAHSET